MPIKVKSHSIDLMERDLAKFGIAIQEVREMFYASVQPEDPSNKPNIWVDAGRAVGLEMRVPETARRNSIGGGGGNLDRYDSKGTSLPWAVACS